MSTTAFAPRRARPRPQRGQAALVVVMVIGFAATLLIYGMVDTTSAALRRDQNTAALMAEVKRALIGWSAARDPAVHGVNARPGELPCPDMDNNGLEDGSCAAGAIGRVPWKTLGIPEPMDAAGETLWYAIAGPFRIWNMNNTIINNDTPGNITVYQNSTSTTITNQAVAVIFAPGAALGAQNRDRVATVFCPTTGTTIVQNLCAGNYLETTASIDNGVTNGPFISAPASATFNDKVLVITTSDLMPPVERRVAREMLALLKSYRSLSGCACYPWAANHFDDDSVTGRTRGMVPIEDALPHTWGSLGITVPAWLIGSNQWGHMFYYAIAPSQSEDHDPGTLTVDGSSRNLVLITTGPAGSGPLGQFRPSTNLPDYVDDAVNNDGNDIFQTPSSTAYARDRIYTIP